VIIGDLNRNGQLQNFPSGPEPDDTSVILRLQQDGTAAPGNPFVPYCSVTTSQLCPIGSGCPTGQTCLTQVRRYYAYGVRNSFGMAIDPDTGDLWDTENGPNNFDEVNRVLPGFNSGWEQIMGPDSLDPQGTGDLFNMPGGASAYSDPEYSWVATIAPTSIIFPVGSALGVAYDGVVLVGDNNTGQLYRFPLNTTRTAFNLSDLVADTAAERDQFAIGSGFGAITDLEIGPDGALYVVSLTNGAIYRISARTGASPTPTATMVPPTATRTATFSPPPVATQTPTRTLTRTATATPPAATATLTPSPSATRSATRTRKPHRTRTPKAPGQSQSTQR
jgi:glucose/arabinose dehydrogenase